MAELDKDATVSLKELMVSTLAMADPVTKLLIEKGVITEAEFKQKLLEETSRSRRCRKGEYFQASELSYLSPFICDSPARRRLRHSDRPGTIGAQGCQHDDGLHPCIKSRGTRSA